MARGVGGGPSILGTCQRFWEETARELEAAGEAPWLGTLARGMWHVARHWWD